MRTYNMLQNMLVGLISIIMFVFMTTLFLFNCPPVVVVSGSMEPAVGVGSICFINGNDKEPKKGEIIAYERREATVVHRVVDSTGDGGYITKGDNNDSVDGAPVYEEQIVGIQVFSVPIAGYVIMAVKNKNMIIIIIALLFIFVLLGQIRRKSA